MKKDIRGLFDFQPLVDGELTLRLLTMDDVTDRYVSWLRDADVYQYLETRHSEQNRDTISEFVSTCIDSDRDVLMGIFVKDEHIGNVKLGPIHWKHWRGEIGLFIGEKEYWGKGLATRVIKLVSQFGFEQLHLTKLMAGCDARNLGSKKAFLNAGFSIEAELKANVYMGDDVYDDSFLLGRLNHNKTIETYTS